MKTAGFRLLILTLSALLFAVTSSAQSALPFVDGETLTYEAKVSRIIKGIAVADLSFTLTKENTGNFMVKSEARSKGTLIKLFRFSFFQQYRSTMDGQVLHVLKTVKHDVQKERVRDGEALFDYTEDRVTYVETDPNDPSRPPRKIASKIENNTYDIATGVYALRTMPFAVGKTIQMEISDSGLAYTVPVKIIAREQLKTIFGKTWCYRVEPDIFGRGRLIEREGKMTIWFTDDARRLPVRSQINTEYGRVEVKLKTAANLK